MKLQKYKTGTVIILLSALLILISACGQAGFDVSLTIPDTDPIDLTSLTSALTIQAEIPVTSTNLGIDLEQLIYNYTVTNSGSDTVNMGIKLSLYGEATSSTIIRVIDGTVVQQPEWLSAGYEDAVAESAGIKKGWIYLITPTDITGGTPLAGESIKQLNSVINEILKQDDIWIVADITTTSPIAISNAITITNQSIQVTGTKDTGYFPGAFGTF